MLLQRGLEAGAVHQLDPARPRIPLSRSQPGGPPQQGGSADDDYQSGAIQAGCGQGNPIWQPDLECLLPALPCEKVAHRTEGV